MLSVPLVAGLSWPVFPLSALFVHGGEDDRSGGAKAVRGPPFPLAKLVVCFMLPAMQAVD